MWNGDKHVVVLRGVPGAGKTYFSQVLVRNFLGVGPAFDHLWESPKEPAVITSLKMEGPRTARSCATRIVSADHFFIRGGQYVFGPARIHDAHQACWKDFYWQIANNRGAEYDRRLIIVDNTNIGEAEIAPYVLPANALGWNVMIISVVTDRFETAAARQQHGVPEARLTQMWTRFGATQLPPWWTHFEATSDGTAPEDPGIPGATPVPQPVSEWRFQ